MKILQTTDLPCLSADIKALVRDGIYALYEVRSPDAAFVVDTQHRRERYCLAADGEVVRGPVDPANVEIVAAVSFAGLDDIDDVRVNCG